jgi:foldase protein PrsA
VEEPPAGPPPVVSRDGGGEPPPPIAGLPEVVAEIDGEKITRDEFLKSAVDWWGRETLEEILLRRILDKAQRRWEVSVAEKDLDERVEIEIRVREAEYKSRYGVSLEQYLKQFGKTVEQFRREVRDNEAFRRQVLLEFMIGYAYLTEPKVEVAHLVVGDEAKARDLLKKAREGADFGKLAEQESDDGRSAGQGGRLPGFIKGMSGLGEAFEDAAFALQKAGDLSPVVTTSHGWHVLKLIKKEPARPQTFDAVRAQVKKTRMERAVLDLFVRRLRTDYAKGLKYFVPALEPAPR